MSNSPWYADPTAIDTSSEPTLNSNNQSSSTEARVRDDSLSRELSKIPPGKTRVEHLLKIVHELDPKEYNRLVDSLTIEEQNELTQRLLKSRKNKGKKNASGSIADSWYFEIPDDERDGGSVIVWWEKRRLAYNLLVLGCGLMSTAAVLLATSHPLSIIGNIFVGILIYGTVANVCYTWGWITELITKAVFKDKAQYFGPMALGLGTAFSMLLTLVPAVFFTLWIIMHLMGLANGYF